MPLRGVSHRVGLPLPVVSAVRKELEKRGLFKRGRGIELTELGLRLVEGELGISCRRRFPRPDYPLLPLDMEEMLHRMRAICEGRPGFDETLDQSHVTPQTAVRRALYLYENDGLGGRNILVLGDDDLTSVAISLLSDFLGLQIGGIVVLEVDERLVAYISEAAGDRRRPVKVIKHNLRDPLPVELTGQFDVFFTDPPYTLKGLELFVSRGIEALRSEVGKQGYVCFGQRTPDGTAAAIRALTEMGLAPTEIVPSFNRYEGAQVLGGVSQMIRTVASSSVNPRIRGPYAGPLYTADWIRNRRLHV